MLSRYLVTVFGPSGLENRVSPQQCNSLSISAASATLALVVTMSPGDATTPEHRTPLPSSLGSTRPARSRTPRRAPLFPAIYPACRAAPFPSWITRNVGSEIWSIHVQSTVVASTRFRRNVPSRRPGWRRLHMFAINKRHFLDVGPVCVLCASSALGAIRSWSWSRSKGANPQISTVAIFGGVIGLTASHFPCHCSSRLLGTGGLRLRGCQSIARSGLDRIKVISHGDSTLSRISLPSVRYAPIMAGHSQGVAALRMT